jgi:hypothetical protein
MGYARRVKIGKRMERDCPNKGFKSLSPWKGALAALI